MGRPLDHFVGDFADDAAADAFIAARSWNKKKGWLYYDTTLADQKQWDGANWIIVGSSPGTGGLKSKSGLIIPGGFSGSPLKATVTFAAPFASTNYTVTVHPVTQNNFSYLLEVQNKTVNGFDVYLGSNDIGQLVEVGWQAMVTGES